MKTDITYTTDGFWVSFTPQTKDGENAWREMVRVTGDGKVPIHQLPSVKAQLKKAGYTIRKARHTKSKISDAELLSQLGL